MGLKQRRSEDEEFMITLNQVQQMVEVMANAVRRLREQAEVRLAAEENKRAEESEASEADAASEESPLVH